MGFFSLIKNIFNDDDYEEPAKKPRPSAVLAFKERELKDASEVKPETAPDPIKGDPISSAAADIFLNGKFDYAMPTPEGFTVSSSEKEDQILFTNPATTACMYVLSSVQKATPDLFIPEVANNLRAIVRTFFDGGEIIEDYFGHNSNFFDKKNLTSKYYGAYKGKKAVLVMLSSYFNNNSVVFIIRTPLAHEKQTMDACLKSMGAFSFLGAENRNDMETLDAVLDKIKQDFSRTPYGDKCLGSVEMLMQLCYQDFLTKRPGSPAQFTEGLMSVMTMNNVMEMNIQSERGPRTVTYAEYLDHAKKTLTNFIES
jgi:hypothetical protein